MNDNAKRLASNIVSHPHLGLTLKGFVSDNHRSDVLIHQNETSRVIGDLNALFSMARADQVDVVYIATNVSDRESIERIIEALGDSTVSMYLVPNFYTAEIMQGNWVTVGDTPTVNIIDTPTLGIDSWVKRAEDIIISFFGLLLLVIPMVFHWHSSEAQQPRSGHLQAEPLRDERQIHQCLEVSQYDRG